VTLIYNGTPVSHLTATTIEVRNDGTTPIERSDFERPLLIKFPKSSLVLAATLGEKAPEDLQPVITLEAGAIAIAPLLLNPGDRFRVTAQLLGDFHEPAVEARISGIRAISRDDFRDSPSKSPWTLGTIAILGLCGYSYLGWHLIYYTIPGTRRAIILRAGDTLVGMLILALASGLSGRATLDALDWSSAQKRYLSLIIVPICIVSGAALAWFGGKVALPASSSEHLSDERG
jgi:hypothetical protein